MGINLNLIPQYKKNEIILAGKVRAILRWEIELFLVIIVFVLLLGSLNYVLQFNLDTAISESENKQSKEKHEKISALADNFKIINAQVSVDEEIQKDQLNWSIALKKLSGITPDGISVDKISSKAYHIFVFGMADTRDVLLEMKEKIMQENCFSDVNLPLSNLVSKDNVNFQIEFNIKEDCLKNK